MRSTEELEAAIQRYEKYARVDTGNAVLQLSLGDLYHQAGRFAEAIACYERCLAQAPDHKAARSRLASVLISQHRFAEAEESLRRLIAEGESDPGLLHNLGLTLYYQNDAYHNISSYPRCRVTCRCLPASTAIGDTSDGWAAVGRK